MTEYINDNIPGFWIALGFILLAAEVMLFGFTTIIFLFAGLGALTTGILMNTGLVPETWIAGTATFGISTGIISAALWRPLRKMQDKSEPKRKPTSDIVGIEFVLMQDISTTSTGKYRYSGVDWQVEIDAASDENNLEKGTRVVVVSVDVGIMRVIKK